MSPELKGEVLGVLSNYWFGVIATVDTEGRPEAAIVGFACSPELEMLVGTSLKTRKYANVQQNSHVAIAIGDQKAEVQYEGDVTLLEPDAAWDEIATRFGKLPGFEKYRNDPDERWLLISPTWLRLTVHENPNRVEEVIF